MKKSLDNIYNKKTDLFYQEINDEIILVPIKDNVVDMKSIFKLNNTAGKIWGKINGFNSQSHIINWFANKYGLTPKKSGSVIKKFLAQIDDFIIIN